MQAVSASWFPNLAANSLTPQYGVFLSFAETIVSSNFFTIGSSTIGGPDFLKSGGSVQSFFDQYLYTDYSSYLIASDVTQQIGQYPWGIIMATADLQLDNSTNIFTPNYDPVIGAYIKAGRPFKWSLGFNGEVLQQFTGFTTNPQDDQTAGTKALTYQAYDVFNYIATYQSATTPVQVGMYAHQIIAAGLQEMGFSSSQYVLDQSLQQPIGVLAPYGYYWGDIFNDLCQAEGAMMFADENGIIHFWNRQHFLTTGGPVWQLDYSNIESLQSQDTPIFNDVIVQANPRAISTHQQVWALGTAQALPPGQSVIEADFSDEDGAMPVTSLDNPAPYTAAASSSFTANSAADGSGSDVTANISLVSAVNQGTSALMTFNNPTAGTVYMTAITLYGTPAKVTTPISIRYTDPASVKQYGTNPGNGGDVLTLQALAVDVIQDVSSANSVAYILVNEFKDGRQRYVAKVFANPAIQLGDGIQLVQQDGYSLTFTSYGSAGTTTATGLPATNTPFSVSAWFKIAVPDSSTHDIVSLLNGSSGLQLQLIGGVLKATKGGGSVLVSGVTPTANVWHNVVYTFDGTNHDLYLDGALLGTSMTAPAAVTPNTIYLSTSNGTLEPFNGQIDTAAVWNTTLSPTNVSNCFSGALPTTGLVSRWMFGEGNGTTTADSYGSNNLTISGGAWTPLGCTGIKTMYVVGRTVTHGVDDLSQTLYLEERQITTYFTVGTSTIGGTDSIAP